MSHPRNSSRPSVRAFPSNLFAVSRSPLPQRPPRNNDTDRHLTAAPVASQPGAAFEQRSSTSQPPRQPLTPYPSRLQHGGSDMFSNAHRFQVVANDSTFVNNPTIVNNPTVPTIADSNSDNFMASFLKETIIGAEFDYTYPNMPISYRSRNRLNIIRRCQDFALNREGRPKIRWVVGAAGVGKSAIMQSVAHDESHVLADIIIGATIFFYANGRQDGTKAITTIAYQLAVKLKLYRRFIQREVTDDPSLCQKSLSRQFDKFIVEPFIHQRILDGSSQMLITIDGLDEYSNPSTQLELLGLITNFCIAYPTSPIVWLISSRPESHITSFFAQPKLALSYEKDKIARSTNYAQRPIQAKFRGI